MEKEKRTLTMDVIIPVYKPGKTFSRLLAMLNKQTFPVQNIIVINTEKKYWNPVWEEETPNLVLRHIKKEAFDHGSTRRMAVELSQADVFLCMTDDAVPADTHLLAEIAEGFALRGPKGEVPAMVYARQLPAKDCSQSERYTRYFNYPKQSRVKTKADIPVLGIKTYMASNVCCAYRREIYERQGGFIHPAIFNEDMIFAGRAVQAGYAVVYQAEAKVIHSHNYRCIQQFRRNFDLAVSQVDYPDVFSGLPSEGEGIRLVKATARYLAKSGKPWLIGDLVLKSGSKYAGYLLGKHYRRLPKWMVKCCTMNRTYWAAQKEEIPVCAVKEAQNGGNNDNNASCSSDFGICGNDDYDDPENPQG